MNCRASGVLVAAVLLLLTPAARGEQRQTTRGLFIGTLASRVELTVYAEPTHGRRLQVTKGSLRDVPTITPSVALRIFSNMPNWQPAAVVVGTAAVLREDNAETRTLPFASRMVNVFALELRVADLEQPAKVAELLESVRASGDNPGYVFVVMFSSGLMRYYPVRLALECFVGGTRVRSQPGRFYGAWMTSEVVGPFKGEPGTEGW